MCPEIRSQYLLKKVINTQLFSYLYTEETVSANGWEDDWARKCYSSAKDERVKLIRSQTSFHK